MWVHTIDEVTQHKNLGTALTSNILQDSLQRRRVSMDI
jgi:hypothetical protein